MANYSAIKAAVNAYIKENGRKEITGRILNAVLTATIDSLGKFFQFAGVATPSTDPEDPDQNVCYLAGEPGTYVHFDNITLENEEIALLFYDGTWSKQRMLLGIQEVSASVDANVGTPSVDVSYSEGSLVLTFHNLKGEQGNTGAAAGFGTVGATVDDNIGTPGVSVQTSGPDTAKNLMFTFTNLKGETGVTSVVATVDNTSGTPSCAVSLQNQQLTLAFSGLKGLKGDTGVSADYPITIYNGLDSDATDQALAAAQGKILDGKISQLEDDVDALQDGMEIPSCTLSSYPITTSGAIGTNSSYKHTSAISVKKGQLVKVSTAGYGICLIAKYESGTYTPIVNITTGDANVPATYLWTVTEDMSIVISVKVTAAYGIFISAPILDRVMEDEDTLNTLSDTVNGVWKDVSSLNSGVGKCILRASGTSVNIEVTVNANYRVAFFPATSGKRYKIHVPDTRNQRAWGWCDSYFDSTPEQDVNLGGLVSTDTTTSGNTYDKEMVNTGGYPYIIVAYTAGTTFPTCQEFDTGDIVKYTAQVKTSSEKETARENIGAAGKNDLTVIQTTVSGIKELTDYNLTDTPEFRQVSETKNGIIAAAGGAKYVNNANVATDYIPVKAGEHYRILGYSATYAAFSIVIPANNVATPWYMTFASTAVANAYDFTFEEDGYLGLSRPISNNVTEFYLINNGVKKKLDGLIATSMEDSEIQFPNFVYCVYNPNRKVSQRIYFEGLLRRRDINLEINGGRELNIVKLGTPSSIKSTEAKEISITKLNETIKSGQFNLVTTKVDNLPGKFIKHLAIGDSWAAQNLLDLGGNSEGPWNYASVVMDEFNKAEIDLEDNTAKMIQLGRTASWRRNGHYKEQEYLIRSSAEGFGGWSACSFLRFPFSIRTEGAGTMSEKLAWDALGLGRRQVYGNTYDETAPYTAYVAGTTDRVKYLTEVAMGYYHWDYSTELLNYAGITGSYTGTAEQKAAIDAKMEEVLNNPINPFYDWATAINTNGDHAFSLAKYLERYKTLSDDGVTRLVVGSTAGTEITSSQINLYDICKPTHITIELGVNDYRGLTAQEKFDDINGLVSAIHDYDSTIKVGIVNVHLLGLFYPELFTERIATERLSDTAISYSFPGLFDLNKKVMEEYPSEDGSNNTFAVPTHFVQGFAKVGAKYGVTSDNIPIIIDGTDYLHPAINVCHDLGQQIWAWILYTLS